MEVQPTVLVVDDDCSVKKLVSTVLAAEGFTTLSADGGNAALAISRKHPGPIHLLLSDINMPGMDGVTLANLISSERPETALLLMTGHAVSLPEIAPLPILEKPFRIDVLLLRVRQALRRDNPPEHIFARSA